MTRIVGVCDDRRLIVRQDGAVAIGHDVRAEADQRGADGVKRTANQLVLKRGGPVARAGEVDTARALLTAWYCDREKQKIDRDDEAESAMAWLPSSGPETADSNAGVRVVSSRSLF